MADRLIWHVRPEPGGDGWKITRGDGAEPESRHHNREEAIAAANRIGLTEGERGRVFVHDAHGEIDYDWTYGDEPPSPSI